jgi:L-lactate dehydrogenase complex protein LldG
MLMTEQIDTPDKQVEIDTFKEKAGIAAAFVTEIATFEEAVDYTVDLCGRQGACRLKVSGCEEQLSEGAEQLCETKQKKIVAAPGLPEAEYRVLAEKCRTHGFECLDSGLRSNLAGVDIGFTYADIGISETGTLVLNCRSEELRLATMICEYHVCVLPKSRIVADGFAVEAQLREYMSNPFDYTAFITGPSRTADIERVLTIGVHGPLELHILVLEG